jgi:hypothetical protein
LGRVVAIDCEPASRIVLPVAVRHRGRIGERRIAHPDPDVAVALDDRVAADSQLRADRFLAWDLDAATGIVEQQPVIHAAQAIALAPPERQRRQPVAAAVLEGNDRAVLGAIERDLVAKQRAAEDRVAGDFLVPGGDVPAVPDEHRDPSRTTLR